MTLDAGFEVQDLDQNACASAIDECRRRYSRGEYEGVFIPTGRVSTRSHKRVLERVEAQHMCSTSGCVVNAFLNILLRQQTIASHSCLDEFVESVKAGSPDDCSVGDFARRLANDVKMPRTLGVTILGMNLGRRPTYEDLGVGGIFLLGMAACEGTLPYPNPNPDPTPSLANNPNLSPRP